MLSKVYSNIGLPFYAQGSLKTWQKDGYYQNWILGSVRTESDVINGFTLPYNETGNTIDKCELYRLNGAISNAFTYEQLISFREKVADVDLTGLLVENYREGIQLSSVKDISGLDLEPGLYELVVTTDQPLVFESETILVGCPDFDINKTISLRMKRETFNKAVSAGNSVSISLSETPRSTDGIWLFVNGSFITEFTLTDRTIAFTANYDILITDEITVQYAY